MDRLEESFEFIAYTNPGDLKIRYEQFARFGYIKTEADRQMPASFFPFIVLSMRLSHKEHLSGANIIIYINITTIWRN